MKRIIDSEKVKIHEVEEDDIAKWLKEEFKETHPIDIVKQTFPKEVMNVIRGDHHKSKDYGLMISYDHASETWYFSHRGYIREDIKGEGKTYLDAAQEYLRSIRRANDKVLYREIEDQANRQIPENYSVEVSGDFITLYDYSEGYDSMKVLSSCDVEGKSIEEICEKVEELINDKHLPF